MNTAALMRARGHGSSAGQWILPGAGLALQRYRGGWQLVPTVWITTSRTTSEDFHVWIRHRKQWLKRHGLDQAQFPRRRDLLQVLLYTLQRQPLPTPG